MHFHSLYTELQRYRVVWKALIRKFSRYLFKILIQGIKIKIYNLDFVSIKIQHVYLEHQKKSDYEKEYLKKKNNGKNDTGPQGPDCEFRKLSETNFRFICQFCHLLSLQTVLLS